MSTDHIHCSAQMEMKLDAPLSSLRKHTVARPLRAGWGVV